MKNSFSAAQLKDFPRLKQTDFELLAHHYLCSFCAHLLTDKVQTTLRPHRPFIQRVWEKEDNKDRQREKDRESESLWSGLVEPFSHNVLPNIQDGAERNYSERIISKDRGEEMLWVTPSKLEPQKPFPSIPPLYLFVTLIHFWHPARAFSRVQKKKKKKNCWNSESNASFFSPLHNFLVCFRCHRRCSMMQVLELSKRVMYTLTETWKSGCGKRKEGLSSNTKTKDGE